MVLLFTSKFRSCRAIQLWLVHLGTTTGARPSSAAASNGFKPVLKVSDAADIANIAAPRTAALRLNGTSKLRPLCYASDMKRAQWATLAAMAILTAGILSGCSRAASQSSTANHTVSTSTSNTVMDKSQKPPSQELKQKLTPLQFEVTQACCTEP